MIKWFRKLRYGDTSETPKYINKKVCDYLKINGELQMRFC